jgi:hypothetical protein
MIYIIGHVVKILMYIQLFYAIFCFIKQELVVKNLVVVFLLLNFFVLTPLVIFIIKDRSLLCFMWLFGVFYANFINMPCFSLYIIAQGILCFLYECYRIYLTRAFVFNAFDLSILGFLIIFCVLFLMRYVKLSRSVKNLEKNDIKVH